MFTGTHGVANGLDEVIGVAGELKKRGRKNIKIALVGSGKLKPSLQKKAKELNLPNLIFHEPVPKQSLVDLMASADIGLQVLADVPAFYYGTSPNKFFDYISAGLPVINNYPGWLASMIDEYDCGYTVPPGDIEAFANALEHAAGNKSELERKGKRALELAKAKFDRNDLANKWVKWVAGVTEV